MAKKKKNNLTLVEKKSFAITSAAIADDFCNYGFEVLSGVNTGDVNTVKGKGIIDEDLRDAFQALNVHLAAIDDAFADTDESDIERLTNDEIAAKYYVTGFKIKGSEDDESIVLIGTKQVSASHDRMSLVSPKVPLKLSSYKFADQLKEAADKARLEVELYRGGKCTVPEEGEENPNQLTIADANFEDAKV